MHATLAWQGSLNINEAASDIIAVLTGETDKNNLSPMNLPGGTTIASSFPAGWEIWDDDTGTIDEWILRAPTVDDATQYKYVRMRFYNSSSYLTMEHQLMEDWNPTTNTATNAVVQFTIRTARHPATSYGPNNTTEVIATARYILIRSNLYASNVVCGFPCIEITRTHPCLEIGTGRIPAVQMNNGALAVTNFTTYNSDIPRILDDAGTTDLAPQDLRNTNSGVRPSTNISNEFDNLTADIAYDNAGNPSYGIHAIVFDRRDLVGQVCGDSSASDLFIMQGEIVTGFEDRTLHTLDLTDDRRLIWDAWNNVTTHGNVRYVIQAE